MLKLVFELLYPRFKLVDQLLQRLHCIITNWCHREKIEVTET
jgi:hypothetical protein